MSFVLAARLLLYAQMVLGILQSPGVLNGVTGILHTHRTLAFVIPAVAFWAFRPLAGVPGGFVRTAARFGPLVALVVGSLNWVGFKMLGAIPVEAYLSIMAVHIVVSLATVAFVEIAAGKQRRARAGSA